jgi:hypothetical protein
LALFADWPNGPSLNLERPMGDQKNQGKQNTGLTDEEQEREKERADYQKDQASSQEKPEKQGPQFDPNHIQNDPNRAR